VLVLVLLLVAAPAFAWQPPSGGPSKMAKHVLDSLPDPSKVAIPKLIEEQSRSGAPAVPTAPPTRPQASPGGCWEVQITALGDPDRARDLATQEATRLGVPTHVVTENGLAKVRAGEDCLSYDDATNLRDRARDTGYPGAFVIRQSGGSGS
jgi:cell division septation protein DedD